MSAVPGTYKNQRPKWSPDTLRGTFGTIGVLTNERGTYALFWNDLINTLLLMMGHNHKNTWNMQMGADICGQLNTMIRGLQDDEWLWIMGDDHTWDWDLLPRLLEHDVDVIVPHCLRRNPPWMPVVNEGETDDGWQIGAQLPEEGLTEIWSAGSAGMLIKREVLDAIGDPWFIPAQNAVGLNQDIYFCQRAREAGFKIYCDPSALLGHVSNYTICPSHEAGSWNMDAIFDKHTRIPIRRLP